MTVSTKVKTTLATLEGVLADFKVSYLEAHDDHTKAMFSSLVSQTENVLDMFKERVKEMHGEEI